MTQPHSEQSDPKKKQQQAESNAAQFVRGGITGGMQRDANRAARERHNEFLNNQRSGEGSGEGSGSQQPQQMQSASQPQQHTAGGDVGSSVGSGTGGSGDGHVVDDEDRSRGDASDTSSKQSGQCDASDKDGNVGGDKGSDNKSDGDAQRGGDGSDGASEDGAEKGAEESAEEASGADKALESFDTDAAGDAIQSQGAVAGIYGGMQTLAGKQDSSKFMTRTAGRLAGAAIAAGSGLSAATGGLIGAQAGAAVTGGLSAGGVIMTTAALLFGLGGQKFEPGVDDLTTTIECGAGTNTILDAQEGGSKLDTNQEKMAEDLYGALSGMGMSDENIAGIFGNIQVESGFDPTAVQGIFDEPFNIGPRKKAAEASDFTSGGPEGGHYGIGLNQWTFERASGLKKFAEEKGEHWSDWKTQLAWAVGYDSGSNIYQEFISNTATFNGENTSANPGLATRKFMLEWERPKDQSPAAQETRAKYAGEWYLKMRKWDKNESLGNSILQAANVSHSMSSAKTVNKEARACSISVNGGNTSIAEAMATIALPFPAMSKGIDGGALYIEVHDKVLSGDPYYASCDRTVATAVRWSGSDDTFPAGPTGVLYDYLKESSDWKEVPFTGKEEELQPGDIVVNRGAHVAMYIGNDTVEKVWSGRDHEQGATVGSGSLNDRSPGLAQFGELPQIIQSGLPSGAFRFVGTPDPNSKFKDIAPTSKMGEIRPGTGLTTPGG